MTTTPTVPPRGYMPFLADYSYIGPFWVVATPSCDDTEELLPIYDQYEGLSRFDFRFDPFGDKRRIHRIYLVQETLVADKDYETPRLAAIADAWQHAQRWYGGEPGEDVRGYDALPEGFTIFIEAHYSRHNHWLYRTDGTCVCGKIGGTHLRSALSAWATSAKEEALRGR